MPPGSTDQAIPGPLLLRAAFGSLAVLRNNKDISPLVKTQLREASHELRLATEDPSQRASVEKAADKLRSCLEVVQAGIASETDRKVLDGIASVLSYLAKFLGAAPTATAPRPTGPPATALRPSHNLPLPATVVLPPTATDARPAGNSPIPASTVPPPPPTAPRPARRTPVQSTVLFGASSVTPPRPTGNLPSPSAVALPPTATAPRPTGSVPVQSTPVLGRPAAAVARRTGNLPSQPWVVPVATATPPTPPPIPGLPSAGWASPQTVRPSAVHAIAPDPPAGPVPKPRVAVSLDAIGPTLALQLVRIERLYVARASCVDDPNSTFANLQAVERRIKKREATAATLLEAEANTPKPSQDKSEVSSIGAWWLLGEARQLAPGSPALAKSVADISAGPAEEHRIAIDVLRMNPSHASTTDLWAALRGPALMVLRARCLPLLFENHLPDGEALVRMLDDEAVALAAAAALAWCRIQDGSRRLLEKALACPPSPLLHALLFASVTQGDREAMSEVRIRVATGSASTWLIDALAIAGDESDAELLLDLAANPEMPTEYALWALAHLGSSTALAGMKNLENRLEPALVGRAIELVAGAQNDSPPAPGRLLDGKPWSVANAVRRLAAPTDVPLPIVRWTALDLAVRTGRPAPCMYDFSSPTEYQRLAAQAFAACYAGCLEPPPGGWYYFGHPVASPPPPVHQDPR